MRPPITPCTLLAALGGVAGGTLVESGCAQPDAPCVAADALAGAPARLALVEGGRGFLALAHTPDVTVRVEGLVAGFSARVREDGVHVVRAPYGVAGTLPARLEATCDDGDRASAPLELAVSPLRVGTVAPIAPAGFAEGTPVAGPGPRTSPGLAAVAAGVVVVGGFSGRAALADAWLLPRGGDWVRLPVDLARDVGAGSIEATPFDDGRVLLLGPAGATALLEVDGALDDVDASVKPIGPGGAVPVESDGAALVRARTSTASGAALASLALCGRGAARHCRVSAFDERDGALAPWRMLEPTGFSPAGRDGAVVAVDDEARLLVLFGGQRDDGPAADAWMLRLDDLGGAEISWAHLSVAASGDEEPSARRGACGALDPIGHRLIVVGGAVDAAPASGLIAFDLEVSRDPSPTAERPKAWREIEVADMPLGSVGCAAAWDPFEQRLVVGFGAPPAGDASSLWALDVSP